MFGSYFWIIIGFIFVTSLVAILTKSIRKDRGLKVFHNFHSVVNMENGAVMWGELKVFNQGIELLYDKPYDSGDGILKESYLLYPSEIDNILVIFRYVDNLTEKQKEKRNKQISRLVDRDKFVRFMRHVSNLFKRFKDAIRKSVALVIGQAYKTKVRKPYLQTKAETERLGSTVVNTIEDNLFEPMLEQYIGEPVVAELFCPVSETIVELQGYLIDYSNRFIALVNVKNIVEEIFVTKNSDYNKECSVKIEGERIIVSNNLKTPIVVDNLTDDIDSQVPLLKGSFVKFKNSEDFEVKVSKVKYLDVIIPRDLAKIRHAVHGEKLV